MMISKRGAVVVEKMWQSSFSSVAMAVASTTLAGVVSIAAAQTVQPCTQNCALLSVSDATIGAGGSGQVSVAFTQGQSGADEIAAIAFTIQLSDRLILNGCTLNGDGLPAAVVPGDGLDNFRVVVENASCTGGRTHCLCDTATPDAFINLAVYGPNPLPAPGSGPVEIPTLPDGTLMTISLAVAPGTTEQVIPLHVVNEVTDASKPQFQAFLSVGDKDAVDQTCVPQVGIPPCSGGGATSQIAIDDGQITVEGSACVGDCSADGVSVTVDEIVRMVNIALGTQELSLCLAADFDGDGQVTVDEIVRAVNNALNGCPA